MMLGLLCCGACSPREDDRAVIHLPTCQARKGTVPGDTNWQLQGLEFRGDTAIARLVCVR